MRFQRIFLLLPALLLLAACQPTPEEAKEKLTKMKVPQSGESLLAQTKSGKTEDVAKLLVVAGVDPNARQANGMTALMSAVFNNQFDTAKALLEKGADVKLDAAGFNALSLAVEKDNKEMVKLLLANGADPTVRPGSGLSALEKAQQRQNAGMIELLQEKAK